MTRAGQITLGEGVAAGLPPEPEPVGPAEEAWALAGEAGAAAAPRRRRRSRRGGRRRRGRGPGAPASA